MLELCGGSGCIAITVAKTLPAANVTVLELSPEAMEYLRANMARHKADNVTAVQGATPSALPRRSKRAV